MASIRKTGSSPSLSLKPEVKKAEPKLAERPAAPSQPQAEPKANAVKDAVAERFRDSFEAAPRKASTPQAPLREIGDHDHGPGSTHSSEDGRLGSTPKPTAVAGPTVSTEASGRTVVELGSGNNKATVSQTADSGLSITSDGKPVTLTSEQSRTSVIRGGDGNDSITVDASVTIGVSIEGGEGNDVVIGGKGKDTLRGEGGDDYLEGGEGDDSVFGGDGRDVIYGLDGIDRLYGDTGRDYIDGGQGNDTASGGEGDDQVIGGRGDDTLLGDAGNDAVAGGLGTDTAKGGTGSDKLYVQNDDGVSDATASDTQTNVDMTDSDQAGSSVSMEGSDAFRARVQSDLDSMRSLPVGQELLRGLDGSGKTTTIRETSGGNTAGGTKFSDGFQTTDGKPGPGTDSQVNYNTSRTSLGGEDWMTRPPVVGLFHEMVHAHDITNGTLAPGETDGTRNLEQSAVGLPFDHDGDPSTDRITQNRPAENHLRDELNLPTRPRY